jgi:hypothetical protein
MDKVDISWAMELVADSVTLAKVVGQRPMKTTAPAKIREGNCSAKVKAGRRMSKGPELGSAGVTANRPKKALLTSNRKYTAVKADPTMESNVAIGNFSMLPRNSRNSDMKPAIPGNPALAITPKIINEPVSGKPRSGFKRPRNTSKLRVPVAL